MSEITRETLRHIFTNAITAVSGAIEYDKEREDLCKKFEVSWRIEIADEMLDRVDSYIDNKLTDE